MKGLFSFVVCIVICVSMLGYRYYYSDLRSGNPPLKIAEWDAFGYYQYLPAILIYHDHKKMEWIGEAQKKYRFTDGQGFPMTKLDNGNFAYKYLGGVALMELPFFLVAHWYAKQNGYPPDGFSPPYQWGLTIGAILYSILGIFVLRRILLRYFSDQTTGITLAAVCLATNFINYAAIENGQSHSFIFPLYALILYATIKWHERPSVLWACSIGAIIGLAMICRPTEAIMLFIPLLWNTQSKEIAAKKWALVKQYRHHIIYTAVCGLIAITPQLIYWKSVSGSFIYDVGSSWDFLNPHFRVLFGPEKGWFIYTPITIFFMVGMFYIKELPFRKSVLWFCLLNIYIVIGWRDWHYGASYSTRALMQSYPIFALAFGAFVEDIKFKKWRWAFYTVLPYLIFLNFFQNTQYRSGILHYDEMNFRYYGRIYLNFNPTEEDVSLLDGNETPWNEKSYSRSVIVHIDSIPPLQVSAMTPGVFYQSQISRPAGKKTWLKVECQIKAPDCLWLSFLNVDLQKGDSIQHTKIRLYSPLSKDGQFNRYAMYLRVPEYFRQSAVKLYIASLFTFAGSTKDITVTQLEK